jgi:hypothetical protein
MTTPDDGYPAAHLEPDERDPEAPAADAVEQALPANPADEPDETPHPHRGLEVNDYDAVEQNRSVDLDDDYR